MKRTLLALLLIAAAQASTVDESLAQLLGEADTPAEIDRIDPGEEPVIRLNPDDPSYDMWRKLRDFDADDRKPGPFNVQRFEGHVPWVGIPTFFHLPIALTPEDLRVGKVEVAIFGAELIGDMRARSWGPMEMRNPHRSEVYHNWGAFMMEDLDTGTNPLAELTVVDYGDAPTHPMSIERSIPEIRKFVREVAEVEIGEGRRTIPIIIGGGHALMYPDVAGLTDVYGKGKVGVVHFDAHADYAPVGFGHLVTHGNPVRKLLEDGLVPGPNFIQVGLRGPNSTDIRTVRWARENGLRYHMMAEVERRGWPAVMKDVLSEALEGGIEHLFVSFDVDVVDPAFIPGTSTPEPGGLYMREVMPLVRGLCTHPKLVGVEIVELRPDSDPGYTTMLNTKAILRKCLEGLALRKRGITDPTYLHPLTVDDGA